LFTSERLYCTRAVFGPLSLPNRFCGQEGCKPGLWALHHLFWIFFQTYLSLIGGRRKSALIVPCLFASRTVLANRFWYFFYPMTLNSPHRFLAWPSWPWIRQDNLTSVPQPNAVKVGPHERQSPSVLPVSSLLTSGLYLAPSCWLSTSKTRGVQLCLSAVCIGEGPILSLLRVFFSVRGPFSFAEFYTPKI